MHKVFADFCTGALETFERAQFEFYYPQMFQETAKEAVETKDEKAKRRRKSELLHEVLQWSCSGSQDVRAAWEASASEVISLLKEIEGKMRSGEFTPMMA